MDSIFQDCGTEKSSYVLQKGQDESLRWETALSSDEEKRK